MTCVLVHGFHLGAQNWEQVVWGFAPHRLGRIPKAVLIALQQNATMLVFGTGTVGADGVVEADAMHARFLQGLSQLHRFELLQHYTQQQFDALRPLVYLERTSLNTLQEVRSVMKHCGECGVRNLFLVSSPTHLPRCLRDAAIVIQTHTKEEGIVNVFATPSDVSYAGCDPTQVVVIEPPHKPGSLAPSIFLLASRMLNVDRDLLPTFADELNRLLVKYDC